LWLKYPILLVALTCKEFMPIVQELLYQDAVVGNITRTKSDGTMVLYDVDRSPVVRLARTLIERPHLQPHVKTLQMTVPACGQSTTVLHRLHDAAKVPTRVYLHPSATTIPHILKDFFAVIAVIATSSFPEGIEGAWRDALSHSFPPAVCGVLLVLA
jgi:hypothetical protein